MRQHIAYMLSAPYAITRPSVCQMGGSYKTVEVRIMKLSFLMPPSERGRQSRGVRKTSHLLASNINISKTVEDMTKVTIND